MKRLKRMDNMAKKRQPTTINDLPEEIVVNKILNRIPTLESARICLLSRTWRWQSIPHLDLPHLRADAADQIILHHSAPLRLLKISPYNDDEDIVSDFLSNIAGRNAGRGGNNLQTLHIDEFDSNLNALAGYFPNLDDLHLDSGSCNLPDVFLGFQSLRSITMVDITFCGDLSKLFSECPLLEDVYMLRVGLEERKRLEIVAPKLQFLYLEDVGILDELVVEKCPLLEDATFDIAAGNQDKFSGSGNYMKFLGPLSNVKRLRIGDDLLQLPENKDQIPRRLPKIFNHLSYMSLDFNFLSLSESLFAFCLLRSCRNLEDAEFRSITYRETGEADGVGQDFWKLQEQQDVFDKLANIKLTDSVHSEAELDFLKFVLAKAPALKWMIVTGVTEDVHEEIFMSKLFEAPKISKEAQIILEMVLVHDWVKESHCWQQKVHNCSLYLANPGTILVRRHMVMKREWDKIFGNHRDRKMYSINLKAFN